MLYVVADRVVVDLMEAHVEVMLLLFWIVINDHFHYQMLKIHSLEVQLVINDVYD